MATEDLTEDASEAPEEISADHIDEGFVPSPRTDVGGVEIDGEAVLIVEGTSKLHWLNPTGAVVWSTFDGSKTLLEIVAELSHAFGVASDVIHDDVLELTRQMGRAGLLEGVPEETPQGFVMPEGLPMGSELPAIRLPGLDGEPSALGDLRGGRILLVNWSPHCGFCERIAPELAELQPDLYSRGVRLLFLTIGEAEENRQHFQQHNLITSTILLQEDGGAELFIGVGTPSAYLVDEEGRTASELVVGALEVPALARQVAGREPAGDPA